MMPAIKPKVMVPSPPASRFKISQIKNKAKPVVVETKENIAPKVNNCEFEDEFVADERDDASPSLTHNLMIVRQNGLLPVKVKMSQLE